MTDVRPKLSQRGIAQVALRIIDAEGVDALTMRRLGAELRTGAMSIYNYFADRESLLEAVTQQVLEEVVAPREGLDWKETVRQIMRSVRQVGLRHPHVVPLMERHPPRTLEALAFVEAGFRALRRHGFDDDVMARHYAALAAFSFGTLATEVNDYFGTRHPATQKADSPDAVSMSRLLPNLMHVGPTLARQNPEEQFEFGLELLLYGFERLHSAVDEQGHAGDGSGSVARPTEPVA